MRTWRCTGRAGAVRVQAAPNGRDEARLGLSVPGMAGAVERNRARRRLRDASRGLRDLHGYDLIVSSDATALKVRFVLLREQVETAARGAVGRASVAGGPASTPRAARPSRP